MEEKPVLLLDVDGVLNVIGPDCEQRLVRLEPDEHPFHPNAHALEFMRWAWPRFRVVWCTAWRRDANKIVGWAKLESVLALEITRAFRERLDKAAPRDPRAPWNQDPDWKIDAVKESLHGFDGPVLWLEDGISEEAKDWVANRPRTWYVATDGFEGVTPAHMNNISALMGWDPK